MKNRRILIPIILAAAVLSVICSVVMCGKNSIRTEVFDASEGFGTKAGYGNFTLYYSSEGENFSQIQNSLVKVPDAVNGIYTVTGASGWSYQLVSGNMCAQSRDYSSVIKFTAPYTGNYVLTLKAHGWNNAQGVIDTVGVTSAGNVYFDDIYRITTRYDYQAETKTYSLNLKKGESILTVIRCWTNEITLDTLTVTATYEEKSAAFDMADCTIGSDFTMNFYVYIPENDSNTYSVRFNANGVIAEAEGIETGSYLKFSYAGVNPQCLGDEIDAELICGGEVIDTVEDFSVKKYCDRVVEGYPLCREICSDILNYGAEAQKYMGYKTNELVNDYDWVEPSPFSVPEKDVRSNSGKSIKSAGLILSNYNYVYFKVVPGYDSVSLTRNGKPVDFEAENVGEYVRIKTPALKATQNSDVFTLTVVANGLTSRAVYSANSYISAMYDNEKVGDLVKALSVYGDSAVRYSDDPAYRPVYDADDYKDDFNLPSVDYRLMLLEHGASTHNTAHPNDMQNFIDTCRSYGFGGYVLNINQNMSNGYTSNLQNFSEFNNLIAKMKKSGMKYWIYDEVGYPSSVAGGLTLRDHPELIAKGIVNVTKTGNGYNAVSVNKPDDVLSVHTAYVLDSSGDKHDVNINGDTVRFGGMNGSWTLYIFYDKVLFEGTQAEYTSSSSWINPYYPNLIESGTAKAFIENTYKPYIENTDLSDCIAFFTDEPSLMEGYMNTGDTFPYAQVSWSSDLEERFFEMHGYSILDNMHYLFGENTSKAKLVRINYRQTVADLLSKNYFGEIRKYCEANGAKASGHLILEEQIGWHTTFYGDSMQCLRQLSIPGCDVLHGEMSTYLNTSNPIYMAVKYASSVAHLTGKDKVMCEITPTEAEFAFDGGSKIGQSSVNKLWNVMNVIAFNGANAWNSYFDFGNKLDAETGKKFGDYFARLSYISEKAKWDSGIGIYYPINTYQAYSVPKNQVGFASPEDNVNVIIANIGLSLIDNGMDFCMADNQFIREAVVRDGQLTNGKVSFKVIIMPCIEVIPLDVMRKLDTFISEGGSVIWVNRTPSLADKESDTASVCALAAKYDITSSNSQIANTVKNILNDKLTSSVSMSAVKYNLGGAEAYWLLNKNTSARSSEISYESARGFDVYNPLDGTVRHYDGDSVTLSFGAYCALIVVVIM